MQQLNFNFEINVSVSYVLIICKSVFNNRNDADTKIKFGKLLAKLYSGQIQRKGDGSKIANTTELLLLKMFFIFYFN